ncbi:hypothetical protein Cni_G10119 [Canna indica]|uniref:Protein kinase domain-containing protein n=1 Tax=Canna indica TaxID=4628 RepID=A0AAQ3K616_9LILI|nr:hypothetical protein Cni_G10119 [Canna indica]
MAFYSTWSSILLHLFLLLCITIALSKSHCPSSSCGDLHDLHSPFRLREDPADCGDPQFELVCEEERAALYLQSDKYFVTYISYHERLARLVYADAMTASSYIKFSNRSYFRNNLYEHDKMYMYYYFTYWASFMNCTQKIQRQDEYVAVSSLSGNSSTVYVVVAHDAYKLKYLKNSCRFLNTLPIGNRLSPGADIFQLLRQGFEVKWYIEFSRKEIIKMCWQYQWPTIIDYPTADYVMWIKSYIISGLEFLHCIYGEDVYRWSPVFSFSVDIVIILYMFINLALLGGLHQLYILSPFMVHTSFNLLKRINSFRSPLVAVGRFIFAPLVIYAFLAYNCWRTKQAPIDRVEKFLRNHQQDLMPTRYTYSDIIAMTSHFREKLGQGGFGSVFKGQIWGRGRVAVKMLSSSKFKGDDFINEVSTIGRIHHSNVVHLLGFCSDGTKRALVYEYMPNGSLDKYIFSSNRSSTSNNCFTMDKLNDIALGVARGIDYLHHGCDMQILHFDIKPHNILLDHNFAPKISDFGLAKLYPKDCNLVSISAARGTIGYIAPELISRSFGVISSKSDVYSFGMLLMEMAGRRRNVDPRAENSSQIYYPSWIYDQLTQQEQHRGENLDVRIEIDEMERKLCVVGLWCIQMKSCNRPSMSTVVEMLEGDVNNLCMPPRPFFSSSCSSTGRETYMPASSTVLSIISENDNRPELT